MNGEQEIAYITCVNNEEMYAACREALAAQALPEGMRASFVPIRGAASMCAGYQEAQEGSAAMWSRACWRYVLPIRMQGSSVSQAAARCRKLVSGGTVRICTIMWRKRRRQDARIIRSARRMGRMRRRWRQSMG